MTVDVLSVQAYHSTASKRQVQRDMVLQVIDQAMHPSSSDIARLTGLQRTSVTGRLKELEDEGIIRKAGTKVDPWTKKTVNWYARS